MLSALLEKVVWIGTREPKREAITYTPSVAAQPAVAPEQAPKPRVRHEEDESFRRMAFTFAVIGLSAKLARADGEVTREEFLAFRELFPIHPTHSSKISNLFKLACEENAPFEHYARQIARLFAGKKPLFREVLEKLFKIATSDGPVQPAELAILKKVGTILGFTKAEFEKMLTRHMVPVTATDPYRVLGVSPKISDEDLKKQYRRLIREYHPDGLEAYGATPDLIEMAEMKLAAINEAYDQIQRKRGTKGNAK